MIKELTGSKKFIAAIVASLVALVGSLFPAYAEVANQIAQIIMVFIVGQGLADLGKNAKPPVA